MSAAAAAAAAAASQVSQESFEAWRCPMLTFADRADTDIHMQNEKLESPGHVGVKIQIIDAHTLLYLGCFAMPNKCTQRIWPVCI